MSKEESKPDKAEKTDFVAFGYEIKSDIKQARHFQFAIKGQDGKTLAYKENGIWTVYNADEAFDVLFKNTNTLNNELSEIRKENNKINSELIAGMQVQVNQKVKIEDLESQLSKAKELLKDASKKMTKARDILTERDGQPDCWQMLNSDFIESFLKS